MTRKEIRDRRWFKSLGHKKLFKVEIIKTKHHVVFFNPPVKFYGYWERIKSLFNFKRYEKPDFTYFKGRKVEFSKYTL
jgi:hypothetical protein